MGIQVDPEKFERGHQIFLNYINSKSSEPFNDFEHEVIFREEIQYKDEIWKNATKFLSPKKWKKWKNKPEKIIQAVKEACKVSGNNLLYHHRGYENGSEAVLYEVKKQQKKGLADQLDNFFFGGGKTREEVRPRFRALVEYLRENHLKYNWRFLTYLTFLLDRTKYFPFVPDRFEKLLDFYDVEASLAHRDISWEQYSVLLDLAEYFKTELTIRYHDVKMIEVQSYMWVIASQLYKGPPPPVKPIPELPYDPQKALKKAIEKARRKAIIGEQGEKFVLAEEKRRLQDEKLYHLAEKVERVSLESAAYGYDISSYESDDKPLHIEVKTTERKYDEDEKIDLSNYEKETAEKDKHWVLYRVWDIFGEPTYKNLGNVAKDKKWKLEPASWHVIPSDDI